MVEDALRDARFAQNPLVTGDPGIRFYAGAPLAVSEGVALGTLCVIDRKPRKLTPEQIEALNVIRNQVVTQLEMRRALADLGSIEKLLPICSWCRSVENEDGKWISLHEYVTDSGRVTHGICPLCDAGMRVKMSMPR